MMSCEKVKKEFLLHILCLRQLNILLANDMYLLNSIYFHNDHKTIYSSINAFTILHIECCFITIYKQIICKHKPVPTNFVFPENARNKYYSDEKIKYQWRLFAFR